MYLDSAILLKLVVREPDSLFYGRLVENQHGICTSALAAVECRSALLRKVQQGELDEETRDQAWTRLCALWSGGGIQLLPVTASVLRRAEQVLDACANQVPLRSLDALHLATALEAGVSPLVASDRVMRKAAALLKMTLILEA